MCRPGGLVAARDGDYGGIFWFPADPELTEWQALYREVARAIGGEPDAGRHMHAWARQAGFASIRGVGECLVLHRGRRTGSGGACPGPSG